MKKPQAIHPWIRELLSIPHDMTDETALKTWKAATKWACKPCWELKYCPYGPLVEDSPLLPSIRTVATVHNEHLKSLLATGTLPDGTPLDRVRRKLFKQEVSTFDPTDYPEIIPEEISQMECTVFGHICPVVFAAESMTETSETRRRGRYIPFKVKMRVVRRDNYHCQHCKRHLDDTQVEFDHIIPVAKGGSSEEHNIRLTCFDCNRDKSDDVEI